MRDRISARAVAPQAASSIIPPHPASSVSRSTGERGAMCKQLAFLVGTIVVAVAVVHHAVTARAQTTSQSPGGSAASDITDATLAETGAATRNISTAELRKLLASGSDVLLLDTRSHLEWSLGHITGALNVAPKSGLTIAM